MKKFILLPFLISFASIFQAYSQSADTVRVKAVTIKGTVVDENGAPMPYAAVWLSDPSKPGSVVRSDVTRENGAFSLSVPAGRAYILTVRMLGYQTAARNIAAGAEETDLGRFQLSPVAEALSEVVVRPELEITADKIIFNFENHPGRATSKMLDMIQMMPLIAIDPFDGKIIVESEDKTYIVLRKGRSDALFNFEGVRFDELLQRLPAMGFTAFEIWTAVPERWAAYDYVINILPDPAQRLFGAVGASNAGYAAGSGTLSLTQGVNGSADRIRFSGNLSFRNRNDPKTKEEATTLFYPTDDKEEMLIRQNSRRRSSGETYNAGLTASFDLSPKQFVNIGFKGGISDSRSVKTTDIDSLYGGVNSRMQSLYRSTADMDSWELNAGYQLEFDKPERSFNISGSTRSNPLKTSERLFTTRETDAGNGWGRLTTSRATDLTHRLQIDYSDAFKSGKYSFSSRAGYLAANYDRKNPAFDLPAEIPDPDACTRLERNIRRLDGSVTFGYRPVNRLSTSATLRGDYLLNSRGDAATTGAVKEVITQKRFLTGASGRINFRFNIRRPEKRKPSPVIVPGLPAAGAVSALPPAALSQSGGVPLSGALLETIAQLQRNASGPSAGNSSLSLSYNFSQRRPSIHHITNHATGDDPFHVRRGNPNLKPENDHVLNLNLNSWFPVMPTLGYTFSNNRIARRTFSETDANGTRIVSSFDNSGKYRSMSIVANYFNRSPAPSAQQPVNFRLNSIMTSCRMSRTDYGDGTFAKNFFVLIMATSMLTIQKSRVSIQMSYYEMVNKGAYGGRNVNPFSLTLSYNRRPVTGAVNLSYTVTLGDLLNIDNRSRNTVNMTDFESVSKSSTIRIPVSIGISLNYGKFRVKPVRNTRTSATVEGFSKPEE